MGAAPKLNPPIGPFSVVVVGKAVVVDVFVVEAPKEKGDDEGPTAATGAFATEEDVALTPKTGVADLDEGLELPTTTPAPPPLTRAEFVIVVAGLTPVPNENAGAEIFDVDESPVDSGVGVDSDTAGVGAGVVVVAGDGAAPNEGNAGVEAGTGVGGVTTTAVIGEGDLPKGRRGIKDGPGPVMVSDTLCPAVHILEPKMCTAGQRVLRTITGPGPSFLEY